MPTSESGSATPGAGRKSNALRKLKTVALAPVPMATVMIVTAVKAGDFTNTLSA